MATKLSNARSRADWANEINGKWRTTIQSIREVGELLEEAKDELPPAEYAYMLSNDLEFSPDKAGRLIKLARSLRSSSFGDADFLPTSWTTLRRLFLLNDKDFAWARERGLISEKTAQRDAHALVGALNVPEGEVWGDDLEKRHLPKPTVARAIAKETGRGVAASDGRVYFGVDEEEERRAHVLRDLSWTVRNAISDLSGIEVSGDSLLKQLPSWMWPKPDEIADIPTAILWLQGLLDAWEDRNGKVASSDR